MSEVQEGEYERKYEEWIRKNLYISSLDCERRVMDRMGVGVNRRVEMWLKVNASGGKKRR